MQDSIDTKTSFRGAVRERTRFLEILIIAVAPVLLLAVFVLPRPTRMEHVLFYIRPTVLTGYTSHFIHLGAYHLLANMLFYLILISTIYLLWTLVGCRKTFLVIFAVIMLSFPFLLSWVNLSLVRDRFGFGFSGLNAALLGSLPLALTEYLRGYFDMNLDLSYSPVYFFVGLATIAAIAVPASYLSVFAGLMAVFGALIYGIWLIRSIDWLDDLLLVIRTRGYGELALIGHFLLLVFPFIAFPVTPDGGGSLTNYFIHLLGYTMGFIAPFVTLTLVDIN